MSMSIEQSASRRLSNLLQGFAEIDASIDCDIQALSLDSRKAMKGDLFFACAGTQGHGLDFLDQVFNKGVAAVAWEPTAEYDLPPGKYNADSPVPLIAIDNLSDQVGRIADRFYHSPSSDLRVIGITGTDGKTSCSHFLANALCSDQQPVGVIGTLGYGLIGNLESASHTTPDAIRIHQLLDQMRDQGAQYVVMEVSSHGLSQGRVSGVEFEVAVLTNVSRDHLDYHGDEKSYAQAKQKLFFMPGLNKVVLNRDDDFGQQLMKLLPSFVNVVTYGDGSLSTAAAGDDLSFTDLDLDREGISWRVEGSLGEANFKHHLFGRFNVYNLVAVMSAMMQLGLGWDQICKRVDTVATVPGRMEFYKSSVRSNSPVVIIDFAHTPDALRQVLQALAHHGFGRICCVFGCGGDRDKGKRPLMGSIASDLADRVILTDDNPRSEDGDGIIDEILSGISDSSNVTVVRDREQAILHALENASGNDVVLVAGKGHEQYQLIGNEKITFSDSHVVTTWLNGGLH